ncbi:twin-arginine translocase subunit TatC [Candidatus Omnitrophota bacterium]
MTKDAKLTLIAHLDELRNRIIKSVLAIVGATCLAYLFIDEIFPVLIKPVGRLVFIAPQEALVANIKIAFFCGLFLAIPVILFQIWRFISSGLDKKELKYVHIFAPLSYVFFLAGSSFCFLVIVPITIDFLMGFARSDIIPMITISKYVSFVGTLTLTFGLVFEIPLASFFFTKIGWVTPEFLAKKRRIAIVVIFISAAILTPPDVVTQCMMAIPLIVLYEIGILFSKAAFNPKSE